MFCLACQVKMVFKKQHRKAPFTRVGTVGVEEVDLLTAISIHVTGSDANGVSRCVSQGVEGRVAVVNGYVYQSVLRAIVLQHQVGPLVPEEGERR